MKHTGIAASWCPVCGDCICPKNEEGEPLIFESETPVPLACPKKTYVVHDPYCPIHGDESDH